MYVCIIDLTDIAEVDTVRLHLTAGKGQGRDNTALWHACVSEFRLLGYEWYGGGNDAQSVIVQCHEQLQPTTNRTVVDLISLCSHTQVDWKNSERESRMYKNNSSYTLIKLYAAFIKFYSFVHGKRANSRTKKSSLLKKEYSSVILPLVIQCPISTVLDFPPVGP